MGVMGMKVNIENVKRLGGVVGEGGEMIVVRMENEKQKRDIMGKKRNLKGGKKRIMEDWTWNERKMRWKLGEIARMEERKGRRVGIGYGKIKIEEQWWKWDEVEEVLRDGKENIRNKGQGEGREEKTGGM
ncbi:hypothetical protein RF55_11715 [Lasius niger]|uniref:Uncharacterized protein n=1 Tax=Lasius niger TaxID=67767 RepID=A0A0J7KEW6_LASNI|nr:hypothetical protein RF55_11715 [Lasius niger]